MSGGISNLGMGYDPQRVDSSVINTPDYYAQQAAAQQAAYGQQAASIPAPTTPTSYLDSLIQQWSNSYANYLNSGSGLVSGPVTAADLYKSSAPIIQSNLQGQGTINGSMANLFGDNLLGTNFYQQYKDYVGSQPGTSIGGAAGGNIGDMANAGTATPGAYQAEQGAYNQQQAAINAQAQAAAKAAADAEAARKNNQATQQQAYNQQTGGGFNGGILNGSYAQPFGNTITGTANTTGTTGFNGGMMGAGQVAAASTGLNPTGPAAGMLGTGFGSVAAPQAGASWGGPFSNKNPWSLG